MDEIKKYIEKINSLNFRGQCWYVKNKLLSFKTNDVTYTLFFKKLYILLDNLPWYLKETNIEIGVRKELLIKFWRGLEVDKYSYDDMGYVQIECIKLPDSIYFIGIPVKNTDHHIYIVIGDEYNNECKNTWNIYT